MTEIQPMEPVKMSEVVNIAEYEKIRPDFRKKVIAEKERRRVMVGPNFTFLFENHLTVLYQVQEMMRVERIVEDKAIAHEVSTYNELLPPPGGLGATLLVEFPEAETRVQRLRELLGIEHHVWLKVGDLPPLKGSFDTRQMGDDKISSVQYLTFSLEQAHRENWPMGAAISVMSMMTITLLVCAFLWFTHSFRKRVA